MSSFEDFSCIDCEKSWTEGYHFVFIWWLQWHWFSPRYLDRCMNQLICASLPLAWIMYWFVTSYLKNRNSTCIVVSEKICCWNSIPHSKFTLAHGFVFFVSHETKQDVPSFIPSSLLCFLACSMPLLVFIFHRCPLQRTVYLHDKGGFFF